MSNRGTTGRRRARLRRCVALVAAAAIVAGCAQSSVLKTEDFPDREFKGARVLLMPVDVELYEVSTGGLREPKADWTEKARVHVDDALQAALAERGAELVRYTAPAAKASPGSPHQQLIKLHGAVGTTILIHKYQPQNALPTKKDKFDWSLGPGVRTLKSSTGADYGMFVFLRDSYTSAGRAAAIFLAALLFGVSLPGGVQVGFASIVDLNTGDVVWFNRLISRGGDLRTATEARAAIDNLLSGVPL